MNTAFRKITDVRPRQVLVRFITPNLSNSIRLKLMIYWVKCHSTQIISVG